MPMLDSVRWPTLVCLFPLALAFALGCDTSPNTAGNGAAGTNAEPSKPLRLLVIDDPPLAAAIKREWRSRTESEIEVREMTSQEVLKANRLPADAVIFPTGLIGHLAERRLIVPLSEQALASQEFGRRDIFAQVRLREISWGTRTFAVPLGCPQLLLAYRSDVFERLKLSPPATWKEYDDCLKVLSDTAALGDLAPAERAWQATAEPTAEGWASQLLLARAAAYVTHRNQVSPLFDFATMEPHLGTAPYVKALEELAQAASPRGDHADEVVESKLLTPEGALAMLQDGRCAMAITWPSPTIAQPGEDQSEQQGKDGLPIRFAMLPGSATTFNFATGTWDPRPQDDEPHVPLLGVAGRLGAVTSTAADIAEAENFLTWLASSQVSQQVSPNSSFTTLFRSSQTDSAARWTGSLGDDATRSYVEAFEQSQQLPRYLSSIRLPGREEYLAALDQAVWDRVAGKKTSEEALAAATENWKSITKSLGLEQQRQANQRSLGMASAAE